MTYDKTKFTPEVLALLESQGLGDSVKEIKESLEKQKNKYLEAFITNDPKMLEMKKECEKLIEVNYPVLIRGETGTGKELLAKALHGDRKGKFMAINCAGMPDNLIESELFGHVKGAFTGADNPKKGLMEEAENGTMFLDEVGEMPMLMQGKLLRALQEKKIRRVGGNSEIDINCRIVAATHRELSNDFREDLYYRLNTFELYTSPLLERQDDIKLILKALDKENRLKEQLDKICLRRDQLCGNVRSLEQIVLRYYILGKLPE